MVENFIWSKFYIGFGAFKTGIWVQSWPRIFGARCSFHVSMEDGAILPQREGQVNTFETCPPGSPEPYLHSRKEA